MAGKPSPHRPSISQLTSQLDPIPSVFPETAPREIPTTSRPAPNFELFEYQSPDQRTVQPKNSDYGGHHLAFYVDDIEATVAYLREKGLRVLGEIKTNAAGPAKGLSWIYVLAPWGTQLEFLSYPKGLEYEKTRTKRLWDPRG
jgi:catechol 2,3-dioxygenase-like lactoylglutathione lyase family enzyme